MIIRLMIVAKGDEGGEGVGFYMEQSILYRFKGLHDAVPTCYYSTSTAQLSSLPMGIVLE